MAINICLFPNCIILIRVINTSQKIILCRTLIARMKCYTLFGKGQKERRGCWKRRRKNIIYYIKYINILYIKYIIWEIFFYIVIKFDSSYLSISVDIKVKTCHLPFLRKWNYLKLYHFQHKVTGPDFFRNGGSTIRILLTFLKMFWKTEKN